MVLSAPPAYRLAMGSTKPKVMIVDDEDAIRQTLELLLRAHQFDVVTTARDGIEALATLDAVTPDIVVTDYQMPRMNGLELCSRIRSTGRLSQIPTLVLSASDEPERSIRSMKHTAFLRKPSSITEISSALRDLLGEASAARVA
jgi:chemosensory pili system protein ChpA (sensor histidine kinase/response regulator)